MAKAVQKRVRKPWTKQDDRSLRQLVRAKTPLTKIARELKRTAGAVRGHASKLRLSLDIRVKKKKTKAKTATKTRTVKPAKSVKAAKPAKRAKATKAVKARAPRAAKAAATPTAE